MKVAVLVDVENTRPNSVKYILEESASYGKILFKRAYADFNKENLKSWKPICSDMGLETVQQFSHVAKRGSSDGALIVDGMTLMFTTNVDIFCIASSDSDFTKMAISMRGYEKKVIGFGSTQTPLCFQNACERFVYIENLLGEPHNQHIKFSFKDIEEFVTIILSECTKENINLSYIKDSLLRKDSSFDTRSYGCKTMSQFIKNIKGVQTYNIENVEGIFVKLE